MRLRLLTRAFHPEARSHHPITVPSGVWVRISAIDHSHQFPSTPPFPTEATFAFPLLAHQKRSQKSVG
ncbi:hypothetical protein BLL52_3999 [Rhodoferax antarcticus ANT.BR]|uniref:Uncharacterized protein n=1 Tax=Rhodoferax antarcticus ANT.BR TaxID=1111071 RepID=A0A1Q8Y9J8_9BURK|nr:hypothetical protein BLL52_3999 [Rhodoferax antarcticus ANT.BR]